MSYGVVSTGFERKPLAVILAEIEAANIAQFGPDVIQTAQSPLGQMNGLAANLIAQLWETAEDIYQSYDIEQSEGTRLDIGARLRLLTRAEGESDLAFRSAITNQGRARIDLADLVRAIAAIPGVTYARAFVNDSGIVTADNPVPAGTICVAVLGGSDAAIANAMSQHIVPGIATYGNAHVDAVLDGYCRSFFVLRPALVPVKITVNVKLNPDIDGCPAPSLVAVRDTFYTELTETRPISNGDDLTAFRIRSPIEGPFPNVEVVSFFIEHNNVIGAVDEPLVIPFGSIAFFTREDLTVVEAIP